MEINSDVRLEGERDKIVVSALIDTGAEISLLPLDIARSIGAWHTNQEVNVVGVHGDEKTLPIIAASLHFPALRDVGSQFAFAMGDSGSRLIVGMDILKPLGITIDTSTHQLSVKNEVWEAFKTLTSWGVIIYGGVKLLKALTERDDQGSDS